MNFASFFYPPPVENTAGEGKTRNSQPTVIHRPIRVSQDAIGELFTMLAYQIEYLLSIGKNGTSLSVFEPVLFHSQIFSGVCVPTCPSHNSTLSHQLIEAIRQASKAPFPTLPTASANVVKMRLRVRVSREFQSTAIFGFLKQTQKQVIAVWEFRVVKTPTEVTVGVVPTQSTFASPVSQQFSATATTVNSTSFATTEPSAISVYSNEASDIRKVLELVIQNVFSSIDATWYEDVRGGDLVYEIDTIVDK